jgi:hypothetical protein
VAQQNKQIKEVEMFNVGSECMSAAAQEAERKARLKELFTNALFRFLNIKL